MELGWYVSGSQRAPISWNKKFAWRRRRNVDIEVCKWTREKDGKRAEDEEEKKGQDGCRRKGETNSIHVLLSVVDLLSSSSKFFITAKLVLEFNCAEPKLVDETVTTQRIGKIGQFYQWDACAMAPIAIYLPFIWSLLNFPVIFCQEK